MVIHPRRGPGKFLLPSHTVACITIGLLLTSCASVPKLPVSGELHGQPIATTVDSPLARYYIESYLPGRHRDTALSARIDALHRRHAGSLPSRDELDDISDTFSVDFATLFLAQRLLEDDCNRALNAAFAELLDADRPIAAEVVSSYTVLFVPGWDYVELGYLTGADFARPRQLADEFGLRNDLVALPSTGGVEQNAQRLAAAIAARADAGTKLILAGASSAGPAIHLALGELLDEHERRSVSAWLNLGGLLQGTPLIDRFAELPLGVPLLAWSQDWDREALLSMSARRSRVRFARLKLDDDLLVVNYLGVPLSGQISRHSQDKYPILKSGGPNDGLTMLVDALAPNSLTIVALGSDHFFAEDPDMDDKTVALMKLMLTLLEDESHGALRHCRRPRPGLSRDERRSRGE